ncbi:winged helix-turn-helix transcriptional regulator [Streptomyces chattanoogensis]|uniref:winged helix-turn-helix transcriptional regulator n=1 Tax=Streptomyces chattanoogensis TaxID=66876 RepID=UPI00099D0A8F
MASTFPPATTQLCSVNAQRVEETLRVAARRWTAPVVEILTPQRVPMRVCDIAARLPHVTNVYRLLNQMHSDGLVTRTGDHTAVAYQLTDRGCALAPVRQALFEWSWLHLSIGAATTAERVEDAARRLYPRRSTAVVQALDELGPTSILRIAQKAGLQTGYTARRLERFRRMDWRPGPEPSTVPPTYSPTRVAPWGRSTPRLSAGANSADRTRSWSDGPPYWVNYR